jgi:hypothetical protein
VHEPLVAGDQLFTDAFAFFGVARLLVPLVELAELLSLLRSGGAQLIRYFTIRYRI